MSNESLPANRRAILIGAAALAGLPLLAAAGAASAAGTMPRTNVKYQEHPNGANQCSKCNYFLAGAGPGGTNLCKIVAGPILPTAWCTMFAPKH
jgi:hypothetical protein